MNATTTVPWVERAAESLLGNGLGAGIYRRWVRSLGLIGSEDVLEVGSGAGACARHLAAALPTGTLTCVDIDPGWLDIARDRLAFFGGRVGFEVADMTIWSQPDSYDAVIVHFVLHDVARDDRDAVLANVASSLRPNGRLYLREPLEHGMRFDELRERLARVRLIPAHSEEFGSVPLMGDTVSGVWRRRA